MTQDRQVDPVAPESPLACDLTVFGSVQEWKEHRSTFRHLQEEAQEIEVLDDGYRLHFPASTETLLAVFQFVAKEHLCCPFFGFTVEVEREHGPIRLSITGRPGAKEVLLAGLEML